MSGQETSEGGGRRRVWVWLLLGAYVGFMLWVAWRLSTQPEVDPDADPAPRGLILDPEGKPVGGVSPFSVAPATAPALIGEEATQQPPSPTEPGLSGMSKNLNAPGQTVDDDIALLQEVLVSFRTGLKGGNPVGSNREITRALCGDNPRGWVWIDPAHPAIDASGRLCDRWGSPFFFHQESAHAMGLRSAGPDREMFTGDDALYEPPGRR